MKNRPNEIATINAAVCDKAQTLHYVAKKNAAVSGVWEFAAESFRKGWWKGMSLKDTVEIQCKPLQTIIDEVYGEKDHVFFDFYSLDIEGGEFKALQSLDFNRVSFGYLLAESDSTAPLKNMALRTFLESKGYTFLEDNARSWWFVNNDFGKIYEDVLYENTNTTITF